MCKTLNQAITDHAGGQAAALLRHTSENGIQSWSDCTKAKLADFRDFLADRVAPSSARTYIAVFKAILGRYEDEGVIPCKDFRDVLHAKGDKPVKTYLSVDELNELEKVPTRNQNELFVLRSFLVGAFTGMRVSDTREVTDENIVNGYLHYVSIKTGIHATIPCNERIAGYIHWLRENDSAMTLKAYNAIIRRLCKRAGIDEKVKVRHGGVDEVKAKWECVSSHTARISFATNLSIAGLPLVELSRLCGHTNTSVTEGYIASHAVMLPASALAYLNS